MPISGLLITLDCDSKNRADTLAALRNHPAVEIGEGEEHRIPIVVDTPSSDEDRDVWDWLHQQPGITFVDVVYVHFDEDEASMHGGMKASEQSNSHASMSHASMPSNSRGES